jgi:hypothetical protein
MVNKENKYIACPVYEAGLPIVVSQTQVCDATEVKQRSAAGNIKIRHARRVSGQAAQEYRRHANDKRYHYGHSYFRSGHAVILCSKT